jgi:formate-dependent phosphoribosylglycinamide formyltransferase (GAR transformylase)
MGVALARAANVDAARDKARRAADAIVKAAELR